MLYSLFGQLSVFLIDLALVSYMMYFIIEQVNDDDEIYTSQEQHKMMV